ncbi:MAG: protoporphyrinogen oxidase HemJ [Alphaproteobacteria bacterium]|nr:protoporphyrinogen oxidase HemJ [Alphaproteobacteria bacterium]
MIELSPTAYLWIKALHIVAVIAWMAGLLYLPRLFVYHADAKPGSEQSETFKVMERRLLRAIMTPAMIAALVLGLVLLFRLGPAAWTSPWWWGKVLALLGLFAMHGMMSRWRRDFEQDRNARPAKFYRIINEIPTVLMIVIVILAVVKPG